MTTKIKISKFNGNRINLYTCLSIILLIFLFNVLSPDCKGQVTAKLTQPQLTLNNDSLIIEYNILGTNQNEMFNVSLEISDNTGAKINAVTLTGDIGDSIKGGINKQIIWNLSADNIFLSANINVEIIAEKIIIPVAVIQEKDLTELSSDLGEKEEKDLSEAPPDIIKKEEPEDVKESHKVLEETVATPLKVKVGKHLLQSTIFPGWGLTKLSKGKPYWIMGVTGVGCIATSIYFNQQSYTNYNNYLDSNDKEKIDTYFNNAITQDNISKALAYTAAGIWVADLVIVGIKAGNINKSYKRSRLNAFAISSCIDSNTDTPMLTLYFNF